MGRVEVSKSACGRHLDCFEIDFTLVSTASVEGEVGFPTKETISHTNKHNTSSELYDPFGALKPNKKSPKTRALYF